MNAKAECGKELMFMGPVLTITFLNRQLREEPQELCSLQATP